MPQKYRFDIEQNTDEWYDIKVGKLSASVSDCLLMEKKNKGYQTLKDRLIEETITKKQTESNVFMGNFFTERGHELEPIAISDFEIKNLKNVVAVGVVEYDNFVLCSPDGLINHNGLIQIKCPIFNTQRKYLEIIDINSSLSDNDKLKKIDSKYYKQCIFELFVTGREYDIFYSYHPHLKEINLRITRDSELIEKIKTRVKEMRAEVFIEVEKITNKYN